MPVRPFGLECNIKITYNGRMEDQLNKRRLFKRLPKGQGKDAFLPKIRCSETVRELILQKAKDAGKSYSEYMLECGQGRAVRSNVAATVINEMRDLAAQLKELARTSGTDSEVYRDLLQKIGHAIVRVGQGRGRL